MPGWTPPLEQHTLHHSRFQTQTAMLVIQTDRHVPHSMVESHHASLSMPFLAKACNRVPKVLCIKLARRVVIWHALTMCSTSREGSFAVASPPDLALWCGSHACLP